MKEIENIGKIRKTRSEVESYISESRKNLHREVLSFSRGGKITKAQCYSCVGYEDVKNAILDCRGFSCPLYFIRHYNYEDTEIVRKILLKESLECN